MFATATCWCSVVTTCSVALAPSGVFRKVADADFMQDDGWDESERANSRKRRGCLPHLSSRATVWFCFPVSFTVQCRTVGLWLLCKGWGCYHTIIFALLKLHLNCQGHTVKEQNGIVLSLLKPDRRLHNKGPVRPATPTEISERNGRTAERHLAWPREVSETAILFLTFCKKRKGAWMRITLKAT